MDPHSRAPKKNTSHENEVLPKDTTHLIQRSCYQRGSPCQDPAHNGNEVLPQDTMHRIQRPCYQRGSPCQDPAGNWTTRRPPDHCKETQTAVVWSCFPFIRSGQNHFARHSERGKKTRRTKEEVGRQHQGMDGPGVRQVMLKVILNRLKPQAEKIIAEEQAGFRAGRRPQSRSSTYAFSVRNISSTSKTSTISS